MRFRILKSQAILALLFAGRAIAHLCNGSLSDFAIGDFGLRGMTRDQCFVDTTYNTSMTKINTFLNNLRGTFNCPDEVTASDLAVCSNDTSVHTFSVWNDSGGGMKQVFIIENNGNGGLNGVATDVDFRNAVVNFGSVDPNVSGASSILFVSPLGQAFYSPITIFKSGDGPTGAAVWRVGNTGAMVTLAGGLASTVWSICANSDQSCASARQRFDEFGRQLWTRNIEQAVTIADNGAGTAAASTLTPTSTTINITCNDTNGCDITMSEIGAVTHTALQITNVSINTVNFADIANVSELAGAFAAGQWDTIAMRYVTDRWVETGRSNN